VTSTDPWGFAHPNLYLPVSSPREPLPPSPLTYSKPQNHLNPHLLCCAYILFVLCYCSFQTAQPATLPSFVARASLSVQKHDVTRMMAYIQRAGPMMTTVFFKHRGASPTSPGTRTIEAQHAHTQPPRLSGNLYQSSTSFCKIAFLRTTRRTVPRKYITVVPRKCFPFAFTPSRMHTFLPPWTHARISLEIIRLLRMESV